MKNVKLSNGVEMPILGFGVQNRFYYLRISRILYLIFFLICDIINYERRCLWLKKVN
ncbi:hypothetical protein [Fusobacterium polymorphum]|uniref:hypothetical protein n=1 Tax=Fusobacterium nucleatum subsp. polymorphum TaxID=76857 RepID=UPI00300B6978